MGAEVVVRQGDVSKPKDVESILTEIQDGLTPLKGIIHAAGVIDDGILAQQNWERFEKVMAPKISGAWFLHHFTKDMDLDFFVLFSSMAAILGSGGQGNYAAANAYLDALASHRRSIGLPALSINWGAWSETGMAADLENRNWDYFDTIGIAPLTNAQGLSVLKRLISAKSTEEAQIAVIEADWQKLSKSNPAVGNMPLIQHLTISGTKTSQLTKKAAPIKERISIIEPSERMEVLRNWITMHVSNLMGFEPAALNLEKSIINLGFDSLMAVQLKNAIESDVGVAISVGKILEGPSVLQLTEMIHTEIKRRAERNSMDSTVAVDTIVDAEGINPKNAQHLLGRLDE